MMSWAHTTQYWNGAAPHRGQCGARREIEALHDGQSMSRL